jgi:hypothetical protein
LGEGAIVKEKAMKCVHGADVAHDLAAIIDADGVGIYAAREIDLSEHAIVQEKAMLCASGISENAHNLTAVINS